MLFERSTAPLSDIPQTISSLPYLDDRALLKASHIDDSSFKEKRIHHSVDIDILLKSLGRLSLEKDIWYHTAKRVQSLNPVERYEGTKQLRMMLSVSGDIPIQDVIDTGVVPCLVRFLSPDFSDDLNLQFEAAWAITNIASGTSAQTEVVVQNQAVPQLIQLLRSQREDIREQGMWGLGNIAGDRSEYRDLILEYPHALEAFIDSCKSSRRVSTTRTGIWSLSNLCRGNPKPLFHLVAPAIPYLGRILSTSEDPDTLSDACWALDGLSETPLGMQFILNQRLANLLTRLLCHKSLIVQRPALRVIGQIAAGTADQTQEVLDNGALIPLLALLDSSRKNMRKDACWALSNVAAGNNAQLQEFLNMGAIPKLLAVFDKDPDLDVRKEAAWAICNACTSRMDDQLEYLLSSNCVKPVCDMLTIEDAKILEVALEALENLLSFGDRLITKWQHPRNIFVELICSFDGHTRIYSLHAVHEGYGNFTVWKKAGAILSKWFITSET